MTTVYFVRHAEPNFDNHDDRNRELSPKGMQDRALVDAFFESKEIDLIISSPFRRAYDTVASLSQKKQIPVQLVEDFRERRVDSVWIPDFHTFSQRQWEDFQYKLSDGECLQEVQDRNIRALRKLVGENPGAAIVVGSHGTAISTMIHYYNRAFGFSDYQRIRGRMPWIVEFQFQNDECTAIIEHDLFQGKE